MLQCIQCKKRHAGVRFNRIWMKNPDDSHEGCGSMILSAAVLIYYHKFEIVFNHVMCMKRLVISRGRHWSSIFSITACISIDATNTRNFFDITCSKDRNIIPAFIAKHLQGSPCEKASIAGDSAPLLGELGRASKIRSIRTNYRSEWVACLLLQLQARPQPHPRSQAIPSAPGFRSRTD